MNIMERTSGGIAIVPMETKLLSQRQVFIEGEINSESAVAFSKQILYLCSMDRSKPINVMINSPGGEITSGLVMYDIIQTCSTPIRIYCLGEAYSMGALLFASGNHGRYMLPNSKLMLHEPLLGGKVGGNASSIRSISDSLMETREKVNKILSKHTGKTIKEIEDATRFDHYFTPQESLEFGLCDEIVTFDKIMTEV